MVSISSSTLHHINFEFYIPWYQFRVLRNRENLLIMLLTHDTCALWCIRCRRNLPYMVRFKHTYSRQSLSLEKSTMFGGERTFPLFTGRAYTLDGGSKWVPPPPSSQIPNDDGYDGYEVAPPTIQVLSDDSDERDREPTTVDPMSTYLADMFTENAERIHNCQVMLTSYGVQLQEKRYTDVFLQQLEQLTYQNARNLSLVESAMHKEDCKTFEEVEVLLDRCDDYRDQTEQSFNEFKTRVLSFLKETKDDAKDDDAKGEADENSERKRRRLNRKTSCASSSSAFQED